MRRFWTLLLIAGATWSLALLHRGAALAPDEIEFFRATRWTSLGLVPFRDFWEHHTPLQWLLFAPAARVFGGGAGAGAIVAMRWAQVLLWILMFVCLTRAGKRTGAPVAVALALMLISPTFVRRALEYRVDVPANLAFIAAVWLVATGATRARWIAFGALMSAGVLANMRLAPLVVLTAALALFWRPEDRAWRWSARALWMIAGVAAVASVFVGWLWWTESLKPFLDGVVGYNVASAHLIEVDTFFDAFLLPLWSLDIAGIAFWIAAFAGVALAFRRLRTPGVVEFFAVIAVVSILTVAAMEVHYDYHLQLSWLLMLPVAALAIGHLTRTLWQRLLALVGAVALVVSLAQTMPTFGDELDYQNTIMTEADRITLPGEKVLDGAGFALRREPAWRYWFLTTGVRLLAAEGRIEPYALSQITSDPPAAVVYDYRLGLYLEVVPEVAQYAVTHYVPRYRNLWIPGATMRVAPGVSRIRWIAPRAGAYAVWSSVALAQHPWLTDPLRYASIRGPLAARYGISLEKLNPLPDKELEWIVDGVPQPAGVRVLALRKGSRVELITRSKRAAGVMLVPSGIRELAIGPPDPFLF